MNRKTIDDVRHELRLLKERAGAQHTKDVRRAEAAEKDAVVQRARADAYETALKAVLDDMKRLGLHMGPRDPGGTATDPVEEGIRRSARGRE